MMSDPSGHIGVADNSYDRWQKQMEQQFYNMGAQTDSPKSTTRSSKKAATNSGVKSRTGSAIKKNNSIFTGVYFLNQSNGAGNQGHAAILLVTSDGKGELFSWGGDMSKALLAGLGFNIPGHMGYAKVNSVSQFLVAGVIDDVSWFGGNKGKESYDRFLYRKITNAQGVNIERKGIDLINTPECYNLYSNNCGQVSQKLLSQAGVALGPTHGSSLDEQTTLLSLADPFTPSYIKFLSIAWKYNEDRKNSTIPNALYDNVVNEAPNGWIGGRTGAQVGYNPFE